VRSIKWIIAEVGVQALDLDLDLDLDLQRPWAYQWGWTWRCQGRQAAAHLRDPLMTIIIISSSSSSIGMEGISADRLRIIAGVQIWGAVGDLLLSSETAGVEAVVVVVPHRHLMLGMVGPRGGDPGLGRQWMHEAEVAEVSLPEADGIGAARKGGVREIVIVDQCVIVALPLNLKLKEEKKMLERWTWKGGGSGVGQGHVIGAEMKVERRNVLLRDGHDPTISINSNGIVSLRNL